MVANQPESLSHKQMFVLNFWCLKSANHVKFIEECLMYMEKPVLVKKSFQIG